VIGPLLPLKTPLAVLAFVLSVLATFSVLGSTAGPAKASSTFAIGLQQASLAPTGKGLDLRLAVRGTTGRLVVSVAFRPVGARGTRRQKHVFRLLHGRRFVTFHLNRLQQGATYTYTARAVSGRRQARAVAGQFTVATSTSAVTGSADVRDTSATLHGSLTPGSGGTQAWFAWGPTAALGHATPQRAYAAGTVPVALEDSITGLASGTSYYYRVVSSGASGTSQGALLSLTTTGAPPVVVAPAPPAPTSGPQYFVAPTGSDSANGSAAHPWKTLAKAASATPAGATAMIAAGTYAGFTMTRSGHAGAPIAFQAASAGTVQVHPASGGSTIIISGVHDVSLTGLTVTGATGTQDAGVDVLDGSSDITIANGTISGNHSYGVDVNGSTNVTISGNTITGNDTGIRINRAGAGVLIEGNDVVNNTGMVVDDPAPNNDTGAVGISFLHTVGPLIARGNTIHGNRAPSDDYGYDGGAFEIYGSSGDTMTGNTIWDNQDVLETGTDGAACAGNVFTRNISWGGNDKSLVAPRGPLVNGIILRCGQGMLIANNVFEDMDYWVYDITTSGGFAGSIDGFRIENNVNYQLANKVYAIGTTLPSDAVIDYNVSITSPGAPFASVPGNGDVPDLATFRSLTGQEAHGRFGDPLFANLAGQDFHLSPGSPALDAGTPIAGVTDGFLGAAPDAGAYEQS
jgi:parallel beta-helix repeat protein